MASTSKEIVTARYPSALLAEAREIAEREGEALSAILRRLVRQGLDVERRNVQVVGR